MKSAGCKRGGIPICDRTQLMCDSIIDCGSITSLGLTDHWLNFILQKPVSEPAGFVNLGVLFGGNTAICLKHQHRRCL